MQKIANSGHTGPNQCAPASSASFVISNNFSFCCRQEFGFRPNQFAALVRQIHSGFWKFVKREMEADVDDDDAFRLRVNNCSNRQSVRPHVGTNSSPIFPEVAQKVATAVFT